MRLSALPGIVKEAFQEWQADEASKQGAALAFYSILSMGPLLLVVVSVAGLALGQEAASGAILAQMRGLVGETGAQAIEDILKNTQNDTKSVIAAAIGIVTLLASVSGFFAQLQSALNAIFNVPHQKMNLVHFVLKRVLSFGMVIGIALLLLLSLAISAGLSAFTGLFEASAPVIILQVVNVLLSFLISTLLFAMAFKILPDVHLNWRDVWVGAAVTAALFAIGKSLIGLYLGQSAISSTYGAAGSLIVLLVWIYYSTQIILFGAEVTQVYARHLDAVEYAAVTGLQPTALAAAGIDKKPNVFVTLAGYGLTFAAILTLRRRKARNG